MILVLFAVLSGGFFAFALPPFHHPVLAWFALTPLLVAARGGGRWRRRA